MSDIYDRILEQADKQGITGRKLGELLGLKKSPLTDWKNKKSNPTLEQLCKMCDIFAISSDYLLYGYSPSLTNTDEDVLLKNYRSLSDKNKEYIKENIEFLLFKEQKKAENATHAMTSLNDSCASYNANLPVSILGYVAAGEPIISYENEINTIIPENSKVSYALIAKGNSMDPVILNGEIIEVISQCELENGEIGIIKLNGAVTCKCWYDLEHHYELKSLNADVEPIIVPKGPQSDIQIIGKVALTTTQKARYTAP